MKRENENGIYQSLDMMGLTKNCNVDLSIEQTDNTQVVELKYNEIL